MSSTSFLRARRPDQKRQRRDAILAAARDLASTSGVGTVTLGAVADAVGLAKSNISRYFGTREEIYLELLAEEWQDYAAAVTAGLANARDAQAAIGVVAETIIERTLFCDLLSHLPTSLELNASVEAARAFKLAVNTQLGTVGAALAAVTDLTEQEAVELVAAAGGMAGLLYRAMNPPPSLAQVYQENPELAATFSASLPSLARILTALAAGMPTIRRTAP